MIDTVDAIVMAIKNIKECEEKIKGAKAILLSSAYIMNLSDEDNEKLEKVLRGD